MEGKPSKKPVYRGSSKHKNRPANEQKGTLCPEWTHATSEQGLAHDVCVHNWAETAAAALFDNADCHGPKRRYATAQGIAFEAKPSADGTWHGYPIPWEHVPVKIKDEWVDKGLVSGRQIKRYMKFEKGDIHWALQTDRC